MLKPTLLSMKPLVVLSVVCLLLFTVDRPQRTNDEGFCVWRCVIGLPTADMRTKHQDRSARAARGYENVGSSCRYEYVPVPVAHHRCMHETVRTAKNEKLALVCCRPIGSSTGFHSDLHPSVRFYSHFSLRVLSQARLYR
jgi:hypothetical protein